MVTFEGQDVRLYNQEGNPSTWLTGDRTSPSFWEVDAAHPKTYNSAFDDATGQFSQACGAYRVANIDAAQVNFKYATPFNMRTGYKLYSDRDGSDPYASAIGSPLEIIFDQAATLAAAVSAIVLALLI